jgi:hypothetical protein
MSLARLASNSTREWRSLFDEFVHAGGHLVHRIIIKRLRRARQPAVSAQLPDAQVIY